MQGDDTIDLRLQMFHRQRDALRAQIAEMERTLETVEYKCWFYETAQAAGTVNVPKDMPDDEVPECFRAIRHELQSIPNAE